jgi:hypothetical protein
MYLEKAYGSTLTTAFHALLMYFSMVIAQSFLARTFGAYTLQLFEIDDTSLLVPTLGVGLLLVAFLINLTANRMPESGQSYNDLHRSLCCDLCAGGFFRRKQPVTSGNHQNKKLTPCPGRKTGTGRICSLVYGCSGHNGNSRRYHSQYFCDFQDVGNAD